MYLITVKCSAIIIMGWWMGNQYQYQTLGGVWNLKTLQLQAV